MQIFIKIPYFWVDNYLSSHIMQSTTMLKLLTDLDSRFEQILSKEALDFIEDLHHKFSYKIELAIINRQLNKKKINSGLDPKFSTNMSVVRDWNWKISEIPDEIKQRRVEITGPVDRKMIINALNSGADVFMADFEDSFVPTWDNLLQGQINLFDAVRKNIEFIDVNNKKYSLNEKTAVLFVRPRGIHLFEKNISINNQYVPACLFDFGLYMFHNAKEIINRGSRPYFYLPKLENYHEASLWNEIFEYTQEKLNMPNGTIKATVLIETLPAAFEMHEILFALKEHSAGLNCGRWDYIFSFIKKLNNKPEYILSNKEFLSMNGQIFLKSYATLLAQTCLQRGAQAIGGMSNFIPVKNNPELNEIALNNVKKDKEWEKNLGYCGAWVAHPALVGIVRDIFNDPLNENTPKSDKIEKKDLLTINLGKRTYSELCQNINISLQYLYHWLYNHNGAVALRNRMEDLATFEINRALIANWMHHNVILDDNSMYVTLALIQDVIKKEKTSILTSNIIKEETKLNKICSILEQIINDTSCQFSTEVIYDHLL